MLVFFGYIDSATVQNLGLENVMIEGDYYVGGLVGEGDSGLIQKNHVTGKVIGNSNYIGGLMGSQIAGTIQQSSANVEVLGNDYVGGLTGHQSGNGIISESYSIADVSGNGYLGGLVGSQYEGVIQQSYTMGSVSGSGNYVGGLTAYQGTSGSIKESYSASKVSGANYVGGLVGDSASLNTIDSYWDVEISGQGSSKGGIGLLTEQMLKQNAQTNMSNFDFNAIWQVSNGYPLLHWQTPDPVNEEEILVNGKIEATVLSLTIPSNSMIFALNPNEEVGQQFVISEFELTNESQAPLTLEVGTFEQVTDVLNDVEPTKYTDWTGLNKTQSKDIALALVPKVGDGWLTLNEGNRWVADLGETNIGTIKGSSTVSFGFEAKHGTSFTETLAPQYQLTFVFGLQD